MLTASKASACATARALLCGGFPHRPFPRCEHGEVAHVGPIGVGPWCYPTAAAWADEAERRRGFLASIGLPAVPTQGVRELEYHLEPDELEF